jgi:protein ImuB
VLWVALHLPFLSLESFAATCIDASGVAPPIALVDEHRIAAANATAQAEGVKPGLKRATALALAPRITLGQADAARDAEAMLPVLHAALAFTPQVSLQPASEPGRAADTVLLEVQASLRYFGGLEALLQRLQRALEPLGHEVRSAVAATAEGAAILAHIDPPPRCLDLEATRAALVATPVWLLGPGREHWEALQGMGLRRIGDLLGLPRAGLARRFSETLLLQIDAAFGRRPDPRTPIVPARLFESRLELFARADSTEQVLHGAALLLARLVLWLAAQHAFVRRFRLLMHHETRWQQGDRTPQATALEIALAEPSRDSAHLLVLLRERLARLQLPAPTLELALQAEDIVKRAAPNSELFPTRQNENEGLTRLIERLQARLGAEQVQRLEAVDDHRPEQASRLRRVDASVDTAATRRKGKPVARVLQDQDEVTAPLTALARPVWLQPAAEPLAERRSRPLLDGRPLSLLAGPERIEAGWWDAALAERDYFIAEAADGALVWIYRARLPLSAGMEASGWFLHGRFG